MSRKHIVALAVTGLMLAMFGVLLYEAFDIFDLHDTQPFPVDPEVPLFMLGSMLVLCIGTVALTVRLLEVCLVLSELLPLGLLGLMRSSMRRVPAFEVERLLFSPPRSVTALRI